MINYKELRETVQNIKKYFGCININRSPIINKGYPGKFNLSFTEHPWLIEHERYMDFDHDYIFSTVQSCIRWDDIYDEKTRTYRLDSENSWKYLGVFEMADLAGMISLQRRLEKQKIIELQTLQVINLIELLKSLGISKEQIYPSYQAGGNVAEVTNGKYNFDFHIQEDTLGKQIFLEKGVPEENLIPDRTRDTLLALKLYIEDKSGRAILEPSPWGYRNEININIGRKENPKYVDIATIERFVWKPIYKEGIIFGLEDINDEVSIGAVGLERLCMVANGLENVQQVDCIKPFYDALPIESKKKLIGESLRTLHRIYSDIKKYEIDLSRSSNRKEKVNRMLKTVLDSGLNIEDIGKLLEINAENQPWHPELLEGVEPTIRRIEAYKFSKKR
jgi:hypothetical protein